MMMIVASRKVIRLMMKIVLKLKESMAGVYIKIIKIEPCCIVVDILTFIFDVGKNLICYINIRYNEIT